MSTSLTLSLALVASILIINIGPALSSPPVLRTVCGAVADAEEAMNMKALAAGKVAVDMALKPIAIVGGLKAAAVGTGMKIGGGAMTFVGGKLVKDGTLLEATGAGIKGAGLGAAALGLRPAAEKIILAGKGAEGSLNAANNFVKSVGDTSIQIGATIDSPILGHHHKEMNVSAGLDSASHNSISESSKTSQEQQMEEQVQQQQTVEQTKHTEEQVKQQSQEHSVSKRATNNKIDTDVLKSALNLVKEANMQDCVSRAICDLNCNPQGFGQDGKQVFMNMVRLQGSNVLDSTDSKEYHDAAVKGRSYSGKCDQCTTHYDKCHSKSADLIKMASHIKMD